MMIKKGVQKFSSDWNESQILLCECFTFYLAYPGSRLQLLGTLFIIEQLIRSKMERNYDKSKAYQLIKEPIREPIK